VIARLINAANLQAGSFAFGAKFESSLSDPRIYSRINYQLDADLQKGKIKRRKIYGFPLNFL